MNRNETTESGKIKVYSAKGSRISKKTRKISKEAKQASKR